MLSQRLCSVLLQNCNFPESPSKHMQVVSPLLHKSFFAELPILTVQLISTQQMPSTAKEKVCSVGLENMCSVAGS